MADPAPVEERLAAVEAWLRAILDAYRNRLGPTGAKWAGGIALRSTLRSPAGR